MISALEFYGGQGNLTTSVNTFVDPRFRFWRVNVTAASRTIFLPPTTLASMVVGGPIYFIANVGANTFSLRDIEALDSIINLTTGKVCIMSSYIHSSGAIRWTYDVRNYN